MMKITKPNANRLDLELNGEIDSETMRKALDEILHQSQGISQGRILYTINNFALPTLGAIMVEFGYMPKLFSLLGRFDRCAVLTDAGWLKATAVAEGALIPGFEIKAFDLEDVDAAEAWLNEAT